MKAIVPGRVAKPKPMSPPLLRNTRVDASSAVSSTGEPGILERGGQGGHLAGLRGRPHPGALGNLRGALAAPLLRGDLGLACPDLAQPALVGRHGSQRRPLRRLQLTTPRSSACSSASRSVSSGTGSGSAGSPGGVAGPDSGSSMPLWQATRRDRGPQRAVVEVRRRAATTLTFLGAQFLLGTATNLFVSVPTHHPGSGAADYFGGALTSVIWSFSSGIALLIVHVVIGLLLFLNAIELIVRAVRAHVRGATWLASLGGFGIVFAGFNGASFLVYHEDFSSMLMSAGFALSIVCYGWLAAAG